MWTVSSSAARGERSERERAKHGSEASSGGKAIKAAPVYARTVVPRNYRARRRNFKTDVLPSRAGTRYRFL